MTIAATANSGIAYVVQTAQGATPATPTFKAIRRTGGQMTTTKTVVTSDEISLDGRTRDLYMVGQDPSGEYAVEFSNGSFDDIIAGVLQSDWSTNVISDGSTQKLFTIEERVQTGGTIAYNRFIDSQVGKMSLDITARAGVKGSFSLMAISETTDTAILSGATYTTPSNDPVETAANFASLTLTGVTGTPLIKSIKFDLDRGLRKREVVGSLYSLQHGNSQPSLKGSMQIYFEDNVIYNQVLSHVQAALTFTLGRVSGKKYTFSLPTIKFGNAPRALGGKNDDVMLNVEFEALGTASSPLLQITRAVT